MNRAKSLQFAISLGEVLGWLDGRFAAEHESEASPDRPPAQALSECRELLKALRSGYGASRTHRPVTTTIASERKP